jgi:MoaA/NifB/PqqE/SkfB family radical SAM enzyme
VFRSQLRERYAKKDAEEDAASFAQLEARQFRPDAVLVQISRACNLRCTMCGWAVWGRNKGFMRMELYRHILDELKLNEIPRVNLTNPQGEPLLSPHAIECIRMALDDGFNVYLNSNCTTLGELRNDQLTELAALGRLFITASFSGYDKETHESVYVGSKFEQSSAKLRSLNAKLAARGLERFLTINGIIMERDALQRHLDYLASLGIEKERISMGMPDNFAGIVRVGKNVLIQSEPAISRLAAMPALGLLCADL